MPGEFPYRVPGVSVFKRGSSDGPADPWLASYADPVSGKRVTRTLGTDEEAATRDVMKIAAGIEARRQARLDPRIDRVTQMEARPLLGRWEHGQMIAGHLEDYCDWLNAKGRTPKHTREVYGRARKMVRLCRFRTVADVWAEALELAVAKYLRQARNLSLKSCNDYLKNTAQFTRWMANPKIARSRGNPLAEIEKYNAATDIRRPRRAMSCADFLRVLEVTAGRGDFKHMPAAARVMYYLIKVQTGLRNEEAAELKPENFDLDALPPTVKVEAAFSKHRRLDVLPLDAAFAEQLRKWLVNKPAGVKLFNVCDKPAEMWRADMEAAGLTYRDASGFADLYSLRHTFATQLGASGASMKVVQKLMRHCDIRQTERYMHPSMADSLTALANLPKPMLAQQFGPPAQEAAHTP